MLTYSSSPWDLSYLVSIFHFAFFLTLEHNNLSFLFIYFYFYFYLLILGVLGLELRTLPLVLPFSIMLPQIFP
jgi:hypothetical protein